MNTAKITRTLRTTALPEYKILERNRYKKITKVQEGWTLDKRDGYVSVTHTELMGVYGGGEYGAQFTHPEKTTERYAEFAQWLDQITTVLSAAGFTVEVVTSPLKFGLLNKNTTEVVKEIKVKVEGE